MRPATTALKATIRGGLLFLVPLVILAMVGEHAFVLAKRLVGPLADVFPAHAIAGITISSLAAVLALLVVCLPAGLVARTGTGRRITGWFEDSLLGGIPHYRALKTATEGWADLESSSATQVVLVRSDEGWRIGYVFDRLDAGWLAVFVPAAPPPLSGEPLFLPPDRVRSIEVSLPEAMRMIRRLGVGSAKSLRTIDLGATAAG